MEIFPLFTVSCMDVLQNLEAWAYDIFFFLSMSVALFNEREHVFASFWHTQIVGISTLGLQDLLTKGYLYTLLWHKWPTQ